MLLINTTFICSSQSTIQENDKYNLSSRFFQDDSYGEDDEDRQWDSGGFYKKSNIGVKKLPVVPVVQNYLSKKRTSVSAQENYSSYDDYLNSSVTKTRRKMPQIPVNRSSSRQSPLYDQEQYSVYDAITNISHRGASLPPTPTKAPKVPVRILSSTKPFNSLPPTPGRKLPQVNLNHRSAKSRKNNSFKRTNSAEYAECDDIYKNDYIRPGAMSAREIYNEDYNYAYQSTDNLPNDQEEIVINSVDNSDLKTNKLISVNEPLTYYQQSADEYFSDNEIGDYYESNAKISQQIEPLHGPKIEPVVTQSSNTLESYYDKLKDSFKSAVSSVNISLPQTTSVPSYNEHTKPTEKSNVFSFGSRVSQDSSLNMSGVINGQYCRDQSEPVKAIVTVNSTNSTVPNVTITEPNQTNLAISSKHANSRGFLVQQDTINTAAYLPHQETIDEDIDDKIILPDDTYSDKNTEDHYLKKQDSIESYIEDDPNDISADYTKAISRDSPISVIHITECKDNTRRDSNQAAVLDPFHPSLQQRSLEPYTPIARRASVIDPYRPTTPTRDSMGDIYQAVSIFYRST